VIAEGVTGAVVPLTVFVGVVGVVGVVGITGITGVTGVTGVAAGVVVPVPPVEPVALDGVVAPLPVDPVALAAGGELAAVEGDALLPAVVDVVAPSLPPPLPHAAQQIAIRAPAPVLRSGCWRSFA
jgi:hypothetical protein